MSVSRARRHTAVSTTAWPVSGKLFLIHIIVSMLQAASLDVIIVAVCTGIVASHHYGARSMQNLKTFGQRSSTVACQSQCDSV